MTLCHVRVEQLATVTAIVEVQAVNEDAAADLAIVIAPLQDWDRAWRRSECAGYEVLDIREVGQEVGA